MASLENLRKFREILLQTGNEPEINKQDGITLDDFHFPDKEPAPLPELWEPGTVRREPDIEEPPVVEPEPDLQPEPETQQPEPARQPEPETRQPEPETQQPATDRKPETGNRQPATDRKPEPETRQPEPDLDDDIDLPDGAGFDMDFGDLAVPPEALTHPEVPEAVPEEAPEEAETIDLSESDLSALSEAIDGAAALPESEIPAGIPEDIDLSGLGAEDGGTVPEDIDLSGVGAEDGGIVP
ncbi:MAG: hypothetical protein LBG72_00940, partial [Spirochaetaceae bacterium]|nr:hypothetical protein [Spirochaetaceae bacterium]